MRPSRLFTPLALVVALVLTAVPGSAPATPAPLPTWQVGQAVGYGTNLNLTALAAPFLNQILTNPSMYNLTAIRALQFTGSFDAWVYDEVTEKTTSYYVLSSDSATGLKIYFNADVTANNLPEPGTYTGDCSLGYFIPQPPIPLTTRSVAATVDVVSLDTSAGTTRYQISDLGILGMTVNTASAIRARIDARGVPTTYTNLTTCTETIVYKDENFTLTSNAQVQIRTAFDPALDAFNFPINDNETWWANSTATTGATISGTVDVQGLSDADQKALFDNLTRAFLSVPGLAVTGLDHFPIDLAKITVTVGGTNVLKDGVLQDQASPVQANLRATFVQTKTLSDNAFHSVYLITPASYLCPTALGYASTGYAAVYAPDFPAAGAGMVVGYEVVICSAGTSTTIYELKNTPASDAKRNVEQTKTTYNPFPPSQSNAIVDFFTATPYYGVWIVAAAVVLSIVILFRRRGRKPATAPPEAAPLETVTPPPPSGPET